MMNNLLKNSIAATVIIFTLGVGGASAQELNNPNNLPLCPPANKERGTVGWSGCWGKYVIENSFYRKGDILEGEWTMGSLNGLGKYYFKADDQSKGNMYIGWFSYGKISGRGIYIFADGKRLEGIFENGKFIRTEKINLPDKNNKLDPETLFNPNNLPLCPKDRYEFFDKCWGVDVFGGGGRDKYVGEFRNNKYEGVGYITHYSTNEPKKYIGEWKDGMKHGLGREIFIASGELLDGVWENGTFIKEVKATIPLVIYKISDKNNMAQNTPIIENNNINKNSKNKNNEEKNTKYKNTENIDIELERQKLAEERRRFEEEKRSREQARSSQRINLQVTNTQTNAEGDFVINIQTGTDTASLKINGEEQGGKQDGSYSIKRVARAGQATQFTIVVKDIYGNTDSKTISVTRQVTASSQIKYAELNPALVKTQSNKDAVAIIIGIADYKNLPRADYANDDARVFYDYAIRGLGVKDENIKLLVDADAGQGEIYKAFKTWLPSRVKATTDVYVYYSGHGLPAADGQSLYLLPQLADRDLIEETAIAQSKINSAILAAKPKSVTIFLDSCYSGAGRTGATLLASARPIAIKSTAQAFPTEFTVISASTAEQISSSSNELKHGIFSYYLMRGMEGDADTNKDGKITTGEMHTYLTENVARQASLVNRVQQPQLSGDANRVLIGR